MGASMLACGTRLLFRRDKMLALQFLWASLLFTCCVQTTCASATSPATVLPGLSTSGQGGFSTVPEATTPFEVGITESQFLSRNLTEAPEGHSLLTVATAKQRELISEDVVQEDRRVEGVTPSIVLTSAEPLTTQEIASQYETRTSFTALESGSMMDTQRTDSPTRAEVTNTSRPERSKFLESVRAGITQLISSAGPGFTKQLLQADISPECSFGIFKFMRAIQALEPWALRLIDATAKYPTGFLQATLADVGAYDECIETVVRDDNGVEKVRGQFCNMHVQLGGDLGFLDEIMPAMEFSHKRVRNFKGYLMDKKLTGLRLGLCVISSCSEEDLTNIGSALLGSVVTISVKNCVTNVHEGIDNTQACIIAVLAVLATVIVAATSFDLLTRNWDKERKNSIPYKCLVAFSVMTNTRIILNTSNDQNSDANSLRFIHGIRVLSIFWICLGHSYATITDNITRLINGLHYFERWETLIVTAGFLAVDTFFFLSGFLLYYMLMKQTRNRVVVTVVAIIRRFIRITVPLFFVIMCMYLLPLIASGPNSKEFYNRFYAEVRKHWWDFLFQMRNWRGDQDITTLVQVWYLSADFQFFLVSIVVIQTFKTRKWLAAATFALLSLVSCSISAWQIYGTNLKPFVVAVADTFSTVADTLNNYYLLPFYHGVCYFSGCITFLLVQKYGKTKISKITQASLWCISLFCGLYCMFMKIEFYRSTQQATETRRLFVAFTDRILWSIFIAWFVFTCATGRGGFLNRFLSWDAFVPLSRLSFGVYLIHSPIFILIYYISRERIFFSHFTLVSQCFYVVTWSYILSYFLFIFCEGPTGHLEKMVFMPQRLKEGSRSKEAKNGVQNNGVSSIPKSIPVSLVEHNTPKKYFNGDSLEVGVGFAGSGNIESCRL